MSATGAGGEKRMFKEKRRRKGKGGSGRKRKRKEKESTKREEIGYVVPHVMLRCQIWSPGALLLESPFHFCVLAHGRGPAEKKRRERRRKRRGGGGETERKGKEKKGE